MTTQYFKGDIDEVKIYNYALSGQEITDLFNVSPNQHLQGDVNGDDQTDILDLQTCVIYMLNPGFCTPGQDCWPDANEDGNTDELDVQWIVNYILQNN